MGDRGRVSVVDDDDAQRVFLESCLGRAGFEVTTFADGDSLLGELPTDTPHAICLDLKMPGMDGLTVLEHVKASHPDIPVLILTGSVDVETVVTAMRRGAWDYLPKPVDPDRLLAALSDAIDRRDLGRRKTDRPKGHWMESSSPSMKRVFRSVQQFAASDTNVLIRGESGTGKELVARAVHQASPRSDGPFVAVNCAAIPETLLESELFGHERGAFTGADARRKGYIESADGGTLFLDEIGELAPSVQAKLLRAIERRSFHRLGDATEIRSEFRLVTATHRDLDAAIRTGEFREDLYFRLAVFEVTLPPLRERTEDILPLAGSLLTELAAARGAAPPGMTASAEQRLRVYDWPGNVRELRNCMEYALISSSGGSIDVTHLPSRVAGSAPSPRRAPEAGTTLEEIERNAIRDMMREAGGNVSEVGRRLGIARTTLYRKLRRFGLM